MFCKKVDYGLSPVRVYRKKSNKCMVYGNFVQRYQLRAASRLPAETGGCRSCTGTYRRAQEGHTRTHRLGYMSSLCARGRRTPV